MFLVLVFALQFALSPELEKTPIEFRIDPADREQVELFRCTIVAR